MIEYFKALKDVNIQFTEKGIGNFLDNSSFPVAVVTIALLVLLAVQGYKIFKSLIYVVAAVGLGFVGHFYLAPSIVKLVGSKIPANIPLNVSVAVAFICAMVGVLLAHVAHKFIIFCMGGAAGYCVGFFWVAGLLANHFTNLKFLGTRLAYIAVGCVCALILAIFFLLAFKYIYIFVSSIGFMGLAGYILSRQILPGSSYVVSICFATVGIIIGIFMMIHQFDEDEKSEEFKF